MKASSSKVPPGGRKSAQAETGSVGEEVAARYLARAGCTVVARNWRANPGEVDIIVECPASGADGAEMRELAFVEVRTRHGRAGLAEESISRRKATSMAAAAHAYMASQNIDPDAAPWRIDLIAVSMSADGLSSINWIRGAIDESMINPPG